MQPNAQTSILVFSYSSSYSGAIKRNEPAYAEALALVWSTLLLTPKSQSLICDLSRLKSTFGGFKS
jgi:hypothetical protein